MFFEMLRLLSKESGQLLRSGLLRSQGQSYASGRNRTALHLIAFRPAFSRWVGSLITPLEASGRLRKVPNDTVPLQLSACILHWRLPSTARDAAVLRSASEMELQSLHRVALNCTGLHLLHHFFLLQISTCGQAIPANSGHEQNLALSGHWQSATCAPLSGILSGFRHSPELQP